MTHTLSDQMKSVFDALSQPVFLLKDGTVSYRNPAAANLLVQEGIAAALLLPSLALPAALTAETHTTLTLAGKLYHAILQPMQGAVLCLVGDATQETAIPSDYLNVISTQIRKPLGDLLLAARQLFPDLEFLDNNPIAEQKVCQIYRGLYQLLRLAGQLSAGSQLIQGKQTLCPERIELQGFLEELAEAAEDLLRYTGLSFRFSGLHSPKYGSVDRQMFERAVWNLLSNAISHSDAHGIVEMSAEATDLSLLLRVTDHGNGISGAVKPTVFNRYAHHPGLTDAQDGLGLGLSMVRQIAVLHGGSVMLCSLPDGGTAVTMSISLRHDPEQLHSPQINYDYTGGKNHGLVELADVLPNAAFHPLDLDC